MKVIRCRIEDIQIGDVVNRDPEAEQGWFQVHATSVLFDGRLQVADKTEQLSLSGLHKDIVGVQLVEEVEVDQYGRIVPTQPMMSAPMYAVPTQGMPTQGAPAQIAPVQAAPARGGKPPAGQAPAATRPVAANGQQEQGGQAPSQQAPSQQAPDGQAPRQLAPGGQGPKAPVANGQAPSSAPPVGEAAPDAPGPDQGDTDTSEDVPDFSSPAPVDLGRVLNLLEQIDAPEPAAPIRVELEPMGGADPTPPDPTPAPTPEPSGDDTPARRLTLDDVTAENARPVYGDTMPDKPSYKNPVVVADAATKALPKRRSAA